MNTTYCPDAEERELVIAAKHGDEQAFIQLFERCHMRVYRVAMRIVRNPVDAEEAVQNACVKALQKISGFREEASFFSWFCKITVNEAISTLRSARVRRQVPMAVQDEETGEEMVFQLRDPSDPERDYSRKQLGRILGSAMQFLNETTRKVLIARFVLGMSEHETARETGLPVSSVKSRTYRARVELRRRLAGRLEQGQLSAFA
jgi:RNA polymerase sigma-70 factor (ECF subfamily)